MWQRRQWVPEENQKINCAFGDSRAYLLVSAEPPPWVDEETMKKRKAEEDAKKIEALEKENEALKKRVAELEAELNKTRKRV